MARAARKKAEPVEETGVEEVEEAVEVEAVEDVEETVSEKPFLKSLKGLGLKDLNEVIREAGNLRDAIIEQTKQDFIDRFRAEAAEMGMRFEDLVAPALAAPAKSKGSAGKRSTAPVKFRRGDDTWTGRGRLPTWLNVAEAEGHSRDEFLVKPAE